MHTTGIELNSGAVMAKMAKKRLATLKSVSLMLERRVGQ